MILFKHEPNKQITPDFKNHELFSKSKNAPAGHQLADKVVDGLQFIRDQFRTWKKEGKIADDRIRVTSTYRTSEHNAEIRGSKNSQHLISSAIDFQPWVKSDTKPMELLKADLRSKGSIYKALRQLGINGIGFYNTFLHIDARNEFMSERDEFGPLETWDKEEGGSIEKKKQ